MDETNSARTERDPGFYFLHDGTGADTVKCAGTVIRISTGNSGQKIQGEQ